MPAADPPKPGFDLIWLRDQKRTAERRPALSRERIVTAAIELADERGLDAVSSRAIAARVGAGATSMYWHVPSRADLYELMYDAALGELALPPSPSGDWRKDLEELAHEVHRVFARHRWLVLLGIQPGIGPNSRRYGEFAISALAGAGLDSEKAIQAVAVVNNYITGFAHRKTAWEELKRRAGLEQRWQERLYRYLAEAETADPALARHIKTRIQLTSDDNFQYGLDCVLDGLAANLGPPEPRSGQD